VWSAAVTYAGMVVVGIVLNVPRPVEPQEEVPNDGVREEMQMKAVEVRMRKVKSARAFLRMEWLA